ncbi:hypothetical protein HY045_00555 [Candidatus Woesebacteria bacterium]|nr:hypothetical protein [Candidatus Woesebacteria bacterium]
MVITELFPGGSLKNKAWAEEIKRELDPGLNVSVVYWNDWEKGQDARVDFGLESSKALIIIGDKPYNILAKSVGSIVAVQVLAKAGRLPEKIVLCGLPLNDFPSEILEAYKILSGIPAEKILCIQNDQDPHGSFVQVKEFLAKINPGIKVVSKPADNHSYPYPEDFRDFLL